MLNIESLKDKTNLYQFIAGLLAVAVILTGCLIILTPFFPAILLAVILSLSAWPAFMWLKEKLGGRPTLAAIITTLALSLCFIVPLVVIGTSSAENFTALYSTIDQSLQGDTAPVSHMLAKIPYFGETAAQYWSELTTDKKKLAALMQGYAAPTSALVLSLGGSIGKGLIDLTLGILIAYFFFKHGSYVAQRVRSLIDTFGGARGQHLLEISKNTLIGVVYGLLGTALVQGLLAAISFWATGVPGPTFLGLLVFFVSFTPIGPPVIWIPAALWLVSEGHNYYAIGLVVCGIIIGLVDNILRPWFVSRGSNLPFLLVLLGIIGGIIAFGFIGIFIGPTLLALAYTLMLGWSTAPPEEKSKKKKNA